MDYITHIDICQWVLEKFSELRKNADNQHIRIFYI